MRGSPEAGPVRRRCTVTTPPAPSCTGAGSTPDSPTAEFGTCAPTSTPGIEEELASLRFFWGGAYRITWQGRFRATHIASGEALEADNAAAVRMLLTEYCPSGSARVSYDSSA